jgi:hypothetical protein
MTGRLPRIITDISEVPPKAIFPDVEKNAHETCR